MIFKVLTTIVFISELIIGYTLFTKLLALDKFIMQTNDTVIKAKPGIRDIGYLVKKISAQYIEFSYDFVSKITTKKDDSIIIMLNKILITILIFKFNSKFIKKIRRSKSFRLLSKGFSLLKYVI